MMNWFYFPAQGHLMSGSNGSCFGLDYKLLGSRAIYLGLSGWYHIRFGLGQVTMGSDEE